jgi:hypothetical protein
MNNDLFLNIAKALSQNGLLLLASLACVAWGSLLIFAYLKKATTERFSDAELAALALSGWPAPALLLSALTLFLRNLLLDKFVIPLALIVLLLSAGIALRSLWGRVRLSVLVSIGIFLGFVLLRISYLAGTVMPAYFDSAEHYRITQFILGDPSAWTPSSYYHIGYHYILSALTVLTGADIAKLMLVFGQVIVAALPLPMYVFVRRATHSDRAAFFAVALAGLGWFVPAHAVNWGKYPALMGMLVLQFTLGLVLIEQRFLALLALLFAVRIHTRMAVLLGLAWGIWWLVRRPRWLIVLALGMVGMLIWRYQDFGPLWNADGASNLGNILQAYGGGPLSPLWDAYGNLSLLLVGLLAVFALRAFPRLTAGSVLALLLMLFLTLMPPTFPILDRPLTEMVLSLPLAFLGGLGVSRLSQKWIMPLLLLAVLAHAYLNYSFAPSPCCQLAGRDDLTAMAWIKRNTPQDARILIAVTDYSLGQSVLSGGGTDAGLWVTRLTGRVAPVLPYSINFSQEDIHQQLCWGEVGYIYVGNKDLSFNGDLMQSRPEWYQEALTLPQARIVQVLGCDQ